jgi:TatD DNase family protein
MIDSHCHLAGEEFVDDLPAVIARAQAAGVTRALVIVAAEQDVEWTRAQALAASWPAVRFAVGVHPHQAHVFAADAEAAARAVAARLADTSLVQAIGEIGLDYHYDFSPRELQQAVFRAQLAVAQAHRLPVVIHTREAEADTFALIAEAQQRGPLAGVFHCFTGDPAVATRALATGFYLSFAGILTFPRAVELREAVRIVPRDRLLVETDAPYLAPVPHRGTRNEPARVTATLAAVAAARGEPIEALEAAMHDNYDRLFAAGRPQMAQPQGLSGPPPR